MKRHSLLCLNQLIVKCVLFHISTALVDLGLLKVMFFPNHFHLDIPQLLGLSSGRGIGPFQRPLPDYTHYTHKRQTCMPPAGFEPTIPARRRLLTFALQRSATEIGMKCVYIYVYIYMGMCVCIYTSIYIYIYTSLKYILL